ncbi:hypothetical protein RI129_000819 [Pyrocoelia pectoralis]|uniref:CLIP domain-containing serine protease n=1 Tax=Pyrocoelia pectoralis TaxID=417401 RepID=A0AAN7ZJK1_9COLE
MESGSQVYIFFLLVSYFSLLNHAPSYLPRGATCTTPNGETARCLSLNSCKVILDALLSRNETITQFAKESQCGYDSEPLVCCGTIAYKSPRGSSCRTPNQENANCVPLSSCPVIDNAIKTRDRIATDFARESQCGYDNEPLVCCGSTARPSKDRLTTHKLLPGIDVCGFEKGTNRVYGGEITDKDELPWMTLLRYKNKDGTDAGFKCGGTLINHRYVLTAAHCLLININYGFDIDSVRLGEWRISTEWDCEEHLVNPECTDPVVDVQIAETIPHNNYDRRTGKHDIALVRLAKSVQFTEYIKPICIPHPTLPEPPDGTDLLVAGWGQTENSSSSDYKLKALVPIVSRETCSARIRQRGPITDVQICAGGSQGKDSCFGDSGGPLLGQFPEIINDRRQFYQEGVVAWGVACVRGPSCRTPNQENANCVPLSSCSVTDNAIKTRDRIATDFARLSQCGYESEPYVCCGSTARPLKDRLTTHRLLPEIDVCGFQKGKNRLYRGEITDTDELPWMTLLRYKNKDGTDAGFKCGGTLINHRYVLTAAHCLIINIYSGFDVDSVRLGEWRISTERDCEEHLVNSECTDPVVDVQIAETVPHNNYVRRTGKHDIALVRLAKSVQFTGNFIMYIKPICIPHHTLPEPPDGTVLVVAGWGQTENSSNSDYKLKGLVPIVPRETCSAKFRQYRPITDVHICAGGSQGRDSCYGDSGGPLLGQFHEIINGRGQFYQEGVVAWSVACGVQGFPTVYTRVAKYSTWITDNLKP